jgi:DNA end-binding protein Ku
MAAAVWKGQISFGLVSFPVTLHAAARAEAVHFHLVHKKDQSRVREVFYCVEEDKPVERSELEKGFEVSKGKYVTVEEEELKKIAPVTASTMDVVQFVDGGDVDPIYFESSYYVAADEKAGKAYALFVAALKETEQSAIAKIAMHNREHVVLMRPSGQGLVLHTLYYPDELHKGNRSAAPSVKYSAKELDLAKSLVAHLKAPFKPQEFKDTYRENVEHLIAQKQKGHKVVAVKQPRQAPVIDLMEALRKSLKTSAASRKKAPAKRQAA